MKIKAILADYDGTLVDFDGKYEKKLPDLIKRAQAMGIQFGIATGRSFSGDVAQTISELDSSPLIIVNGGSMILNWKTGESPLFRPISNESVLRCANYLSKAHVVFSLETKDSIYMLEVVDTPAYPDKSLIQLFSLDSPPVNILKILVHGFANKLSEPAVDIHIKKMQLLCKDIEVMKFHFKEYYGIDLTSEQSTKHTAVLAYSILLGISPHEIVAIGDGPNDYPLFTACGYKIAMGNAPSELKEIADIVVSPAHEGGMSQALEHIFAIL